MSQSTSSAVIGLLIAVIAGLLAYILWPSTTSAPTVPEEVMEVTVVETPQVSPPPTPTPTSATKTAAKPTIAPAPITKGGSYENYTTDALGYAALGEVVLFFHSASCPACELLDRDIKTNAARIPKDVKILKVDYDTAADLRQKYGLSAPHILIQVNSKGDRITQWALSSTLSDLVTRIVRY